MALKLIKMSSVPPFDLLSNELVLKIVKIVLFNKCGLIKYRVTTSSQECLEKSRPD